MVKMKYIIQKDKYNFMFSKLIEPAAMVNAGDEIVFFTRDAHNGTVPTGRDVIFPNIELKDCNPVTGPVFVKNAIPGDILVVEIKKINLASHGFVPSRKDMGIIHGIPPGNLARNLNISDGLIDFSEEIKIPIRPMVGTIGVAPLEDAIYSSKIGIHGGNMDNNDIRVGSIVYFPVFAEGALLSLGDVHASMGDGELTSGGIDLCAEVLVGVDIIKNKTIKRPLIETEDFIIVTSNAIDFYEANRIATKEMIDILSKIYKISEVEAYWLISICGDLKISQAFNCEIGLSLRLSIPKLGRLKGNSIYKYL